MVQTAKGPFDAIIAGHTVRVAAGQTCSWPDGADVSPLDNWDDIIAARDVDGAQMAQVGDVVNGQYSRVFDNPLPPEENPQCYTGPDTTRTPWADNIRCFAGEIYTYDNRDWIARQTHDAQANWFPGSPGTAALWTLIAISNVWEADVQYNVGEEVFYPALDTDLYRCIQSHQSQVGWEPPNVPALWELV